MSVAEMVFRDILGEDGYELSYSEVDKHANNVTSKLFPNSKPLGDVRDISSYNIGEVDYIVGGSPCQSFSFAGKRNGMTTKSKEDILTLEQYIKLKDEGFEFKGQSYLFWEFIRVLRDVQKNNSSVKFLLENVVMSAKWEKVITNTLGIKPILIDSRLVSGQQRKRLYWTNINNGIISIPEDRYVDFRQVLEGDNHAEKSHLNIGSIVGRRINKCGKRDDYNLTIPIEQYIEVRGKDLTKTKCITTVQKDNVITQLPVGRHIGAFNNFKKDVDWRYLTSKEALRLQTIPEHYIDKILAVVSENQAYKMAGNGWTFEVIKHIILQAPDLIKLK